MAAERIDFEFFEAIDGTLLQERRIHDILDRFRNKTKYKYPLTEPEIGCYLSHLTLWTRIAQSDHDGAFIFEDDFEAVRGLGPLLQSLSVVGLETDIVSLRQSRWRVHRDHAALCAGYRLIEPLIAPPRTTGYAITKQAASLLYRNAIPFARPVDIDLKHWWESGIRYLTVYPSPLLDIETPVSSINAHRLAQRQKLGRLTRFTRNIQYQARYHSQLFAAHIKRPRRRLRLQRPQRPQDFEEVKVLKGHSGCVVVLCRRGRGYFIRKTSASLSYNSRLFSQMHKQASARRFVRAPKVLGHGYKNDLLYFDMDYVQGSDFFAQLTMKTLDGVGEFVERILDVLESFLKHQDNEIAPSTFVSKIESVNDKIQHHPFYNGSRTSIDRAVAILREASWDGIPKTECHGDLTLENMLFAPDGTITFIDFLDGELSSGWLDLAKLLYDFESGWSLRGRFDQNPTSPDDRLVALLSRYLHEEIRLRTKLKYSKLWDCMPQLQLMQALRVLPYVQDAPTFARVTSFMDGVRFKDAG